MSGIAGYGRYNDDSAYVGCPRAKSGMTPCIARDGRLALADDKRCVGCGSSPITLLGELDDVTGSKHVRDMQKTYPSFLEEACADNLAGRVRELTEPQ